MRTFLGSLACSVLTALFVAVLDHRLAQRNAPPCLEMVDLQQLLTAEVAEVGKQNLPPDQQRTAATAYAGALTAALDEVARLDHAVLLVTPAVLRGAPDATDEVREHLRQKLAAPASPSVSP